MICEELKKISALRGNSSWEIVFGGPFICVLDILVGLFTHITCFGLLYFDILFQTIKTFHYRIARCFRIEEKYIVNILVILEY